MKYKCLNCKSEFIDKTNSRRDGINCPICRFTLSPILTNVNVDKKEKRDESDNLKVDELIDTSEIETAFNILKNLQGHLIVRADKILDLCKEVLKYKIY